MPHLLMPKYAAPVRAQRQVSTVIPRFIASIPIALAGVAFVNAS
jgi:hypothetical protein